MSERRYNEKVDLFSFAMCLVELIDRHLPWAGICQGAAVPNRVGRGIRPDSQLRSIADSNPRLVKLVQDCWEEDPGSRPTFAEVMRTVTELQRELELDVGGRE